jgi:hypothetical protein
MVHTVFVLFAALICLCQSQDYTVFTAKVKVTKDTYNNGYYTGDFYYDPVEGGFNIKLSNAKDYTEIHDYAKSSNYGRSGVYTNQYVYKKTNECGCEAGQLLYAQVPLKGSDSTAWTKTSTVEKIENVDCTKYDAKLSNNYFKSYWETAAGVPCKLLDVSDRALILTNVVASTSSAVANFLKTPSDCKCGKPIDIVVSIDRSGSINYGEWLQEKDFLLAFSQNFEYSNLAANLAVVNWNLNRWTSLPLVVGKTETAVSTSISNMGCCGGVVPSKHTDTCCCCNTPIGGGLYAAGQELLTSPRPTATKIILLITDGCQNHYYDPIDDKAYKCPNSDVCTKDLSTNYDAVKKQIMDKFKQDVKILVIGVGDDKSICQEELEIVAGDPANVFRAQSFDELGTLLNQISATACELSVNPCSATCCGVCACGTCITPDACQDPDPCTIASISTTNGGCCSTSPRDCPGAPCKIGSCDSATGCVLDDAPCPADTNCDVYACDITSEACVATRVDKPECAEGCKADDECSDLPFSCTTKRCDIATGECKWDPIDCSANDDACTTYKCDKPTSSCVNETIVCNDNNPCTDDTCDPKTGCVFTDVVCTVPDDAEDKCLIPFCDPKLRGCSNDRKNCDDYVPDKSEIDDTKDADCFTYNCEADTGDCGVTDICVIAPPSTGLSETETAVAASLGAAATAGIAVGGVLLLAGIGAGGAYAAGLGGGAGAAVTTMNNPMYQGTGLTGESALYKA